MQFIRISRLTQELASVNIGSLGPILRRWRCLMKKPTFVLLAFALFLPATSLAQHSSKAAESKPLGSTAQRASAKAVTLSGQASADGKTLVTDDDDIWTVTNPNVLAGHERQYVSVRCQADPDKKELHLFSVKVAAREAKYVVNRGDSAFRR